MKIKRLLTLILVILAIACLSLGVVGCKNKDKDVEVEKYVDIPLDAKVELFDPFFFGTAAMMIGDEIIEPDVEVTIGDETVITDGNSFIVEKFGTYIITYTFTLPDGTVETYETKVETIDTSAPAIVASHALKAKYNYGAVVELPVFTATDLSGETIVPEVKLYNGELIQENLVTIPEDRKLTIDSYESYYFVIKAKDSSGNERIETDFKFDVKGAGEFDNLNSPEYFNENTGYHSDAKISYNTDKNFVFEGEGSMNYRTGGKWPDMRFLDSNIEFENLKAITYWAYNDTNYDFELTMSINFSYIDKNGKYTFGRNSVGTADSGIDFDNEDLLKTNPNPYVEVNNDGQTGVLCKADANGNAILDADGCITLPESGDNTVRLYRWKEKVGGEIKSFYEDKLFYTFGGTRAKIQPRVWTKVTVDGAKLKQAVDVAKKYYDDGLRYEICISMNGSDHKIGDEFYFSQMNMYIDNIRLHYGEITEPYKIDVQDLELYNGSYTAETIEVLDESAITGVDIADVTATLIDADGGKVTLTAEDDKFYIPNVVGEYTVNYFYRNGVEGVSATQKIKIKEGFETIKNYYNFENEEKLDTDVWSFNAHAGASTMALSNEQAFDGETSLKITNKAIYTAVELNLPADAVNAIDPDKDAIRLSVFIKDGSQVPWFNVRVTALGVNSFLVWEDNVQTGKWLTYECAYKDVLEKVKAVGGLSITIEFRNAANTSYPNNCDCEWYVDGVEIVKGVTKTASVSFDNEYYLNRNAYNNVFVYENSANSEFIMNGKTVVPNMNKKLYETIGKDDLHLLNLSSWGASIPALANRGGRALYVETYGSDSTGSHLTFTWIEILLPDSVKAMINPQTDSIRMSIYLYATPSATSSINLRAIVPNSLTASPTTAGAGTTGEWLFYQNGLNRNAWNTYTSTFGEAAMTNLKTAGRIALNLENMVNGSFFIDDIEIVRDTDGDGNYDTVVSKEYTIEEMIGEYLSPAETVLETTITNKEGVVVTPDAYGYITESGEYLARVKVEENGIIKFYEIKFKV